VARGGSFYDRPERARSGFRLHYQPWQRVYNVGFRIIVEIDEQVVAK
jgi:formylglycine-generating enzyme required for sulfatase activity